MEALEFTYSTTGKALEVNANFFGSALEKNAPEPFFCLKAYTYGFNGMEKDDEIMGSGNSLDFGARMYSSRLGRWFATDPYEKLYAPIAPYVFSLNNPVIFRDLDGNVVVGSDGNAVTYTRGKNGQVIWSSNATADVKRIGNAMLKTPTGREQFAKMQDVSYDVRLKVSFETPTNEEGNLILGRTFKTGQFNIETNRFELVESAGVDVEIYEKNIETARNRKSGEYSEVGLEDGIGAVGGHEAEHATNPENIQDSFDNNWLLNYIKMDVEAGPNRIDRQILKESKITPMKTKPFKDMSSSSETRQPRTK